MGCSGAYLRHVTSSTLASFLRPDGFERPHPAAVLREGSLVTEAGRYAVRAVEERRLRAATPYAQRAGTRPSEPVILVPGFLAGDGTLALMARTLRSRGFRTYRSHIHANIGCTLNAAAQLESRLESIVIRRGTRVQIVGPSLGGMLAPGAHHVSLTAGVDVLVRLSRAGVPGVMSEECVGGTCARQSFDESREPVPDGVGFTAIYSKRDGIVDWRACVDPLAVPVQVSASHVGMALDPRVIDHVTSALQRQALTSALEVDRGESA